MLQRDGSCWMCQRNVLQRDGSCWMCQLSRADVTKSAISSKVYVKAQNKCNPSSVVVSFLQFKMANLSDLMGFGLTVAARYEETFSTAPEPSRCLPTKF